MNAEDWPLVLPAQYQQRVSEHTFSTIIDRLVLVSFSYIAHSSEKHLKRPDCPIYTSKLMPEPLYSLLHC